MQQPESQTSSHQQPTFIKSVRSRGQESPSPHRGSFDAGPHQPHPQSIFHQNRVPARKKQSVPNKSVVESAGLVGSPPFHEENFSVLGSSELGASGIHPGQNRMTREQARNMRISQQRILRETSLETVQQQQQQPAALGSAQQPILSTNQVRNFASEGFSFKSISEHAPVSHGPPQKLVKKVMMKALGSVRQSSLSHRQGPILQSGPHTRSKSSAIGGVSGVADTSMQMPGGSSTNHNRAASRKSNSRCRGTPQGRLTVQQPQQHLRKSQKRSFEGNGGANQSQQQKSCNTITSPKDSMRGGGGPSTVNGDLNTSLPLALSKSHQRVVNNLDKAQPGTSRQQPILKQSVLSQQHQTNPHQTQQSIGSAKAMVTPSGPTYNHTRKQSSTKHRSNSKKRGSINTSIRRQIAKSPDANQRASSLLNNSIQTVQPQQQMVPTQNMLQSKQSTKASQAAKLPQHAQSQHAQIAALAASAFSQQHTTSTGAATKQQVSAEQIILKQGSAPAKQLVASEQPSGVSTTNSNFVLAMSTVMNNNPPPQGHRLTPLIQSSKTGRLSNERKNRSVLYEATTMGDQPSSSITVADLHKSETRLRDSIGDGNELDQAANLDSGDVLVNMLKDGLQKKQQQILNAAAVNNQDNNALTMKGLSGNDTKSNQKSMLVHEQLAAPSSFSSFSKHHQQQVQQSKLEAVGKSNRHQTAQKLRPKNSAPLGKNIREMHPQIGQDGGIATHSPTTGVRRSTVVNTLHKKSTTAPPSVYSAQQAQVFQMMLKQQQQVSVVDPVPVPLQQRLSHNLPHQQSMLSSAQSSRTALDNYLKQQLKSGNQMSSRTVNSVQSGISPIDQGLHRRATTAQELVHELYGSHAQSQGSAIVGIEQKNGVTFQDFHPPTKNSITSISTVAAPAESKSQMVLERDVSGLSPEPRAEIILSKNQIQRVTHEQLFDPSQHLSQPQQSSGTSNPAVAIGKQDSRTQNMQKLKLQQIQQVATQSSAPKKVIKSQRMLHTKQQNHVKSHSNAQQHQFQQPNYPQPTAEHPNTVTAALSQNYLNRAQQQVFSHSTTNQDAMSRGPALVTKSASKVQPHTSKFMVQNWICSADPSEDQQVQANSDILQQLGNSSQKRNQTSRPLTNTNTRGKNVSVLQGPDVSAGANSLHARSLFSSSEHQTAMPLVVHHGGQGGQHHLKQAQNGVPVFNASVDDVQATQSQRLLVQNNQHQLSLQQIQQNQKSVQAANDTRGMVTKSILRSGRSGKDQKSISQAEQSRQKILGPLNAASTSEEADQQLATQDHSAYANNAEDYFKKAPGGTKTPAEKPTKKLTKAQPSGKLTKKGLKKVQGNIQMDVVSAGESSSQTGASLPLTQASMEASPQLKMQQMKLIDSLSHGVQSNISHGSGSHTDANSSLTQPHLNQSRADGGVVRGALAYGVGKSRLSQYVQQPASAVQTGKVPKKKRPLQNQPSSVAATAGYKKASPISTIPQTDDSKNGKVIKQQEKAVLTQSELMRKKNQAKMIGVSSLSMKQQQNLQMQQMLVSKKGGALTADRSRTSGTGPMMQKDPDTTVITTVSALSKQLGVNGSPSPLPNAIHAQMKLMQQRPQTQMESMNTSKLTDQNYFSQSIKEQRIEGKLSSHKVMKYVQPQAYAEGLPSGAAANVSNFQMSEKRLSQPKLAMSRIDGLLGSNVNTEARVKQPQDEPNSQDGLSQNSRYNLSQPALPVSDFQAPPSIINSMLREPSNKSALGGGQQLQNLSLNQQKSTGGLSQYYQQLLFSPMARYEFNQAMPQRLNKANLLERVDKKLARSELILTAQLSTTTSHSSSSFNKEEKMNQRGRFTPGQQQQQQQHQFLSHCVTFDAHANSVIGLQATSTLTGPAQFASLSLDNSVKVWSVTTERPTELISNNRAAAVNLPSRVALKRQIKNQARPSQKLSSFAFMAGAQSAPTSIDGNEPRRTILVTGGSDRVLRLYCMDIPEKVERDYERVEFGRRKAINRDMVVTADVMQPALRITGHHRGVISSITQLPDASSDFFLTGCSDGVIRMYQLSALSEETDNPLCAFSSAEQTGVQKICAMTENTFLSSGHDNSVRLWDVRAAEHQRLLRDSNFGKVTCLQKYSNSVFASANNDGLVNFWDMRKMQLVKQVEMPSHGAISAVQFVKKRQYMIAAHDHKLSVRKISADSSQPASSKAPHYQQQQSFTVSTLQETSIAPESAAFNLQNKRDHALQTEDSWGSGAKITSMVYSETDRKVYVGGFNKKVSVWNVHLENFS